MYYRFFERGVVGSYETDGTIALEEYYNESPETWTPEEDITLPESFCLAYWIGWTGQANLQSMYGKFKDPRAKNKEGRFVMMTIRDFLELACDDSIVVNLYNTEDNMIENESLRSVTAEIGDLLRDEKYSDILECDIESWEYISGEGIIEINYCSE